MTLEHELGTVLLYPRMVPEFQVPPPPGLHGSVLVKVRMTSCASRAQQVFNRIRLSRPFSKGVIVWPYRMPGGHASESVASTLVMQPSTQAEAGMPVLLLSASMAGATAPSTIAGTIVQEVAEVLAGLVYVNAIKPGHPAIFGTWPFGLDLRSGAMSGGSGEQALLTAGCAQMHQFYGLPGGAAAGIADSKLPDMQAGWEQMCSNLTAGLSGVNMVYEAAGMHASLLGFCHESLILGDDVIGQALRVVRGIEVDEVTLALDQGGLDATTRK